MKKMILARAQNEVNFFTCDHPVVLAPEGGGTAGFLVSDVFFPIGNKTALYFEAVKQPPTLRREKFSIAVCPLRAFEVKQYVRQTILNAEDYVFGCEKDKKVQGILNQTQKTKRVRVSNPFKRQSQTPSAARSAR